MQITQTANKPGVIDTLSAGFDSINRRPWLMLVPVLVDLLMWRGPHITALPLFQRLLALYQGPGFVAPNGQRFEELQQTAEAAVAGFNMLSLLVLNFVASVPTTTTGRPEDTPFVIAITSEVTFAALFVLLQLAGILLGCVYFGLIAQQVRDGRIDAGHLFAKLWSYFADVVVYALIVLGAIVALALPLSLLLVGGLFLGGSAANFALALAAAIVYMIGVWALLFLFFVVDAIVVSEVRAPRAILNSVLVVGRNFWSALALIALTLVILTGTQIIWSSLSDSTWGVVAGIVGNAYIASGLAAASMLFYQTRLAGLERDGKLERFLRR